jgi:hypothetical protein
MCTTDPSIALIHLTLRQVMLAASWEAEACEGNKRLDNRVHCFWLFSHFEVYQENINNCCKEFTTDFTA